MASVPTIGGQRYVDRHRTRGKMLVRERIEALVDPDTPFLELSPLAGWGTQDPVGVGSCTGIGIVEGVECAITGSDMTYRGGSGNPTTWKKGSRFHEIARENRLPVIVLNESAGADLPRQADLFIQGGASFKDLTQLSKLGIPSITMAFGPNTAGGAYTPGHERLHGVRQGSRHRLPRRAAAGEDGDRRDRRRGDARRRRDAFPHERPVRLPRRRRDGRHPHHPQHRAPPALDQARPRGDGARRPAAVRPRRAARVRLGRRAHPVRHP